MKRASLVFIIAGLVLVTTVFWLLSMNAKFRSFDLLQFGIILLVVGFAVFVGFKRLTSARRGEPAEDEMSKKAMRKTAAWSYYISLYAWLFIMYISDKIKMETHAVIGMGILGMAVIFAICWLVIHFTGIRNE